MSDTYKCVYRIDTKRGNFSKESVPKGYDAADSYIMINMKFPEDGSFGQSFSTFDGRTGKPLSIAVVWRAWLVLATHLQDREELPQWKRIIAESCIDLFNKITARRENKP